MADSPARLIPAELAPDLLESHIVRHSVRSQAIYCVVLLLVVAAAIATPFTHVDVSVRADGIVRPTADKHELRAGSAGITDQLLVRENQRVTRGDPILVLQRAAVVSRERLVATRTSAARSAVHDLALLTRSALDPRTPERLHTSRYRAEHTHLLGLLRESELRRLTVQRAVERMRALGSSDFATALELADAQLRLDRADAEQTTLRDRQLGEWQAALATERATLDALATETEQLVVDQSRLVVRAPVSGTIEQLARLASGSFVQAGDVVAVVSPDLPPMVEAYVAPRDVGLIRVGGAARFQIDAFNYNDWGVATGRVTELSDDYVRVDDRPMFKVWCNLDSAHLTLRNGVRGRIRKGMTLHARFPIARLSLLQLLRNDVNRWMDPRQSRS